MENCIQVNGATWKSEVLDSAVPVLVDFWAPWCGPCKAIAPVLEELGAEMQGKIKIAKVNVDEDQALAAQFGIRTIPALFLMKKGVVQAQMGPMSKAALKTKIEQSL